MKRYGMAPFVLILMLLISGCNESDVVAIRILLKDDFSGTVSTSSLMVPRESGPLEGKSSGVEWSNRLNLVFSAGTFQSISKLRIADIAFSAGTSADGVNYIQVTLPRGPSARWVTTFSPLSKSDREKASLAFDPEGRIKNIGASVKLRIDLPGPVVGHGLSSNSRGCEEAADKQRAELTVPVEVAQGSGDAIRWHLTWQK